MTESQLLVVDLVWDIMYRYYQNSSRKQYKQALTNTKLTLTTFIVPRYEAYHYFNAKPKKKHLNLNGDRTQSKKLRRVGIAVWQRSHSRTQYRLWQFGNCLTNI